MSDKARANKQGTGESSVGELRARHSKSINSLGGSFAKSIVENFIRLENVETR